ncbi:UNVERIFIED_CONTAM: hypothetical protein RMT77_007359 [Armadillidium vulgare]
MQKWKPVLFIILFFWNLNITVILGKSREENLCNQWLMKTQTQEKMLNSNDDFIELLSSADGYDEVFGLLMCEINQRDGNLVFAHEFPFYEILGVWKDFERHFSNVSPERLVFLHTRGTAILGLRNATKIIASFGSLLINYLEKESIWTWCFSNGGKTVFETLINTGKSGISETQLTEFFSVSIPLSNISLPYFKNILEERRWNFCSKNGVMKDLCDEFEPADLNFKLSRSSMNTSILATIPVIITAGNRVSYLYQSLKSYLRAPGSIKSNFHVLLGNNSTQSIELLQLLNIKYTYISPTWYNEKDFFSFFFYQQVFQFVASNFNSSIYTIILEEDVEVSPDFFTYMSQTIPLLNIDSTLYCVTGFTINGKYGMALDPSIIRRADVQVGWGYALTLEFIKLILSLWWKKAPKRALYDSWIRHYIKGDRECIYPEMSRTLHFGVGINSNYEIMESDYFNMPLVRSSDIVLKNKDRVTLQIWQNDLREKISNAEPTYANPCKENYLQNILPGSYVIYYNYTLNTDTNTKYNFVSMAVCFNLWLSYNEGKHDYVNIVNVSPEVTFYLVAHPQSSYSDLLPENYKIFDVRTISLSEFQIYDEKYKKYYDPNLFGRLPGGNISDLFID